MSATLARALASALVAVGTAAAPAAAQDAGTSTTQPAWPANTVRAEVVDPPLIAGSLQTVRVSGHAEFQTQFDDRMFVSLFVQDATVDRACATTFAEQRQKVIGNPGVVATTAGGGWAMLQNGDVLQGPGAGRPAVQDWTVDTQPFAVRPGVRQVRLCAYVQYYFDEVAAYDVGAAVQQPTCRAPGRVRRGRPLPLRCNVIGPVRVRFTRAGRRADRRTTLRERSGAGRGRVSTRGLRSGRYRVQVRAGSFDWGRPLTVRVR